MALSEFSAVVDLQLCLIRWQAGAARIVDECQSQAAAGLTVAECIQSLQRPYACPVNPGATLVVDVLLEVCLLYTSDAADDTSEV